jgi:hypothetical protein
MLINNQGKVIGIAKPGIYNYLGFHTLAPNGIYGYYVQGYSILNERRDRGRPENGAIPLPLESIAGRRGHGGSGPQPDVSVWVGSISPTQGLNLPTSTDVSITETAVSTTETADSITEKEHIWHYPLLRN